MSTELDRQEQIEHLHDIVKCIDFCMLVTVDGNGSVHSCRMCISRQVQFDGDLYFFIHASSDKLAEIEDNHEVTISFPASTQQHYVSVSGAAQLFQDRRQLQDFWQPDHKAWFPAELDEPNLALLKLSVEKAEYRDVPTGQIAGLIELLAVISDEDPYDLIEDEDLSS
ncbi:pyridoxamine 5'-phosphate oxidase family protein [Leptolyngbya sp. FACHB-261]|uniref:pyridoxamine 5'-phosphate oxidase family protein n=1 Tax=Leptolyngbya sp. FACHB-261 TaxID=2692806 RepID=UPI001687A938|nr:pyridoxamine 5'-phosphate oxidase family protein [Leptolyngbya sp. FACHB-261]MBD2099456.1 pyridoxamine 5'-phosphate oxidase family protein [Leptolyngbya sp. FACHB-261]